MNTVLYIEDFPEECIDDCTRPGDATPAVQHWREALGFTVPADEARECLVGYGAWTLDELYTWSDDRLAECILWLACGSFAECDSLDADSGSDVFCIE